MSVCARIIALGALAVIASNCRGKSSAHGDKVTPQAPVQQAEPDPLPPPDPGPPPVTAPVPPTDPVPAPASLPLTLHPALESIQHDLVDKACVGCHGEATAQNGHVSLKDLSNVILPPNVLAPNDHSDPHFARTDLVRAGCPDQSFFYTIMKEGKMPLGTPEHVSAEDLAIVAVWIKSLGPTDPSADLCKDPTEPGDDDDGPGA